MAKQQNEQQKLKEAKESLLKRFRSQGVSIGVSYPKAARGKQGKPTVVINVGPDSTFDKENAPKTCLGFRIRIQAIGRLYLQGAIPEVWILPFERVDLSPSNKFFTGYYALNEAQIELLATVLFLKAVALRSWTLPRTFIQNLNSGYVERLTSLKWIVLTDDGIVLTEVFQQEAEEQLDHYAGEMKKVAANFGECFTVGKYTLHSPNAEELLTK